MLLVAAALAAPDAIPSDVSTTSIGASAAVAGSIGQRDVDLLFAERLRWTLLDGPDTDVRLFADATFTVDPDADDTFEYHVVRQLGVSLARDAWSLDVGRHPVYRGGPRLVDGLQLVAEPTEVLDVGAWAGLAPDLFTTAPRLRPGGGPIVALNRSRLQLSLVGEALLYDGALDRLGLVSYGRVSFERPAEVSARLDLELAGEVGPHLADGYLAVLLRPSDELRFDAFYDAFSSLRYLQSEAVDPDLQRFQQRLLALGLQFNLAQDALDPTLNQMFGASAALQPTGSTAPRVALSGRYWHHPDELNRYARVGPQAGVVRLPVAGSLDVLADGGVTYVDGALQEDAGVVAYWEPGDEGWLAVDTSVRILFDPQDYGGEAGWYADLFVDFVAVSLDAVVIVGVSASTEPDPVLAEQGIADTGLGAFARITKYLRPPKSSAR